MNLGSNFFSDSIEKVIKNASRMALRTMSDVVGTEHILYGITTVTDCPSARILAEYGLTEEELFNLFEQNFPAAFERLSGYGSVELSPRVKNLFSIAQQIAIECNHSFLGTEHLMLALLSSPGSEAIKLMRNFYNIDPQEVYVKVRAALNLPNPMGEGYANSFNQNAGARQDKGGANNVSALPDTLLEMGTDLTLRARNHQLDPVIGRDDEIQRVIEILCRKTKNNPVLIGEAGVGKTAVVEGLAQAIASGNVPEILANKSIYSLELGGLVAGTKYRGDLEERLKNVIETIISQKNIIVFIDEIHTLGRSGRSSESGVEVSPGDMLKPYLARGELQTIGATTTEEYRKFIETDKALERRFQPIMVNPPSVENTILILKGLKDTYEAFHKIKISDEAIVAAATLSDRYIMDRSLPDKAIDLIDEACSKAKVNYTVKPQAVKDLENKIAALSSSRDDASLQRNYEKAASLQSEIIKLEEEIKKKTDKTKPKNKQVTQIGENEIAQVVSKWTGIPVTKLTESEKEKLTHLEEILHKRVIGQDEAVNAVAKAIRRSRVGLQDNKRPIGSFLFLGQTGVGKTELSKAIAEAMFDDENNLIRLDMSEYMEPHSVSKLIGAPPGYVGFDDGGQLTEAVRRRPYSVVLFDEIEKAHPDIFNLLLQILDDGRLTDSQGRTVNFKNTIIIMTSNVGASEVSQNKKLGFGDDEEEVTNKEIYLQSLKNRFKPEFINRIDVICVFEPLTKSQLVKIAKLLISGINKRLKEKNLSIMITEDALSHVVSKGSNLEYGARPLKRYIQQEIEDKIAEKILMGELKNKGVIEIDYENGELTFTSRK